MTASPEPDHASGGTGTTASDVQRLLAVYREAHDALARLASTLGPDELRARSYCTEWSVADVLSHLGSGAVIGLATLDALAAGGERPNQEFNQSVWAAWDAKTPEAVAADFVPADQALLTKWASLNEEELDRIHVEFGPVKMDAAGLLRSRISEVVLHRWDVEVSFDGGATLQPSALAWILSNVPMMAGYTARPEGTPLQGSTLRLATSDPATTFALEIGDRLTMTPVPEEGNADIAMPAEPLIRLVYGRLAGHVPAGCTVPDDLLAIFPSPS